jgi:uncharacterized membrane protein YkvA (DUF1232 family)
MGPSRFGRRRGWRPADFANDFARASRLFVDRRVPFLLKLLLPLAALVYWVFPLDLIPGLPFDDIAVVLLAMRMFVTLGENAITKSAAPWSDGDAPGDNPSGDTPVVDTTWRVVDE